MSKVLKLNLKPVKKVLSEKCFMTVYNARRWCIRDHVLEVEYSEYCEIYLPDLMYDLDDFVKCVTSINDTEYVVTCEYEDEKCCCILLSSDEVIFIKVYAVFARFIVFEDLSVLVKSPLHIVNLGMAERLALKKLLKEMNVLDVVYAIANETVITILEHVQDT